MRIVLKLALLATLLGCGIAAGGVSASELRHTAVVRALQAARPCVVNIHGQKTLTDAEIGADRRVNGMGTGVVVDERGYIVTNHHVVDGVRVIRVTLADGSEYTARLVARDPRTDLAVIKIDIGKPLPVISIGLSSDLMVGEPVVALGNAYGYEHTATRGIISALHRSVQVSDDQKYNDLIQTDASINPGNSGGPLLNIDGEMIGINVAVRVGAQGIGFAIPVDLAMDVIARLIRGENSQLASHGVNGETRILEESRRFVVTSVESGSPAAAAGVKPGDIITAAGDLEVSRMLDLERAMIGLKAGEQLEFTIDREGEALLANLEMGRGTPGASIASKAWDVLGLQLETVAEGEFRLVSSRYRGGLRVTSVRADGPAAAQGIRSGDVLVGMHIWETVSLENISYILGRPEIENLQPVKFYIVRGSETLYGHMRVSLRTGE